MDYFVENTVKISEDIELYTESLGNPEDKPILLVMDIMTQGLFWPRVFCDMLVKAGFFVIRYDHRDVGRSSRLDYVKHPYSLETMASDCNYILDGYGISKASIMGVGMGGFITQFMAINHSERVDNLILLATSPDQRPYTYSIMGTYMGQFKLSPPTQEYLAHIAQASFHLPITVEEICTFKLNTFKALYAGSLPFPEEEMEELIKNSVDQNKDIISKHNHIMAVNSSKAWIKLLDQIKVPTLVLHGKFDPCFPMDHGEYLANHINGAKLVALDIGHFFAPNLSKDIATKVIDFNLD